MAACLLLVLVTGLAAAPPSKVQWRMGLITLKAGGWLPSVSWGEVLQRIGPSSLAGSQTSGLDPAVKKLLGDDLRLKPCEVSLEPEAPAAPKKNQL